MRILVTGATGYIGGRLVPLLIERGREVRCIARRSDRLMGRAWSSVEIVEGDLADATVLPGALRDVDVAYYLIHSMAAGEAFREVDRIMATTFGVAAAAAGVQRIIYLGGLGDPDEVESTHLVSRHEVGRALAAGGVPVFGQLAPPERGAVFSRIQRTRCAKTEGWHRRLFGLRLPKPNVGLRRGRFRVRGGVG